MKRTDKPNVTVNINMFCGNTFSSGGKIVIFLVVLSTTLAIPFLKPKMLANLIRSLISIALGL